MSRQFGREVGPADEHLNTIGVPAARAIDEGHRTPAPLDVEVAEHYATPSVNDQDQDELTRCLANI
jgi:hypothetical protein